MKRIKRYWPVPFAVILLAAARIAAAIIPFRHLAGHLGQTHGIEPVTPLVSKKALARADRVGWVVKTAARLTPWISTCFAQSLLSAALLRRLQIPHAIYFGLAKNTQQPDGLDAHAWVAAGPCAVVGGRGFTRFVVVGCWVWLPVNRKAPLTRPASPVAQQ